MDQAIACPGCNSQLSLPALPTGQTVQCSRCARVFDPSHRPAPRQSTGVPRPVVTELDADDRDDDVIIHDHHLVQPGPFRGERVAMFAMVMLSLCVLSCTLQVYVSVERMLVAERGLKLGVRPMDRFFGREVPRNVEFETRWERLEDLTDFTNAAQGLLFLPTVIGFLIWIARMSTNNRSVLQTSGSLFNPGWAIASFFIPFANLCCPYMIVQELWRASHPTATGNPAAWKQVPRGRLVILWWLLCLAGLVLICRGSQSDRFASFELQFVDAPFYGLGSLCFLVAGCLQIFLIHNITQRQRARYIRLYEDPA